MKRQRTESFSPETKGKRELHPPNFCSDGTSVVTSARNFEYSQAPPNWMAPDASPGVKPHVELPQGFWRANPQESPITPAFSPFTPNLQIPPPQSWNSGPTEPNARDEMSWPLPQRSISYSNLEGLQGHPQYGGYQQSQHQPHNHSVSEHYTTKPRVSHSGMYPPLITTSTGPHSAIEPSPSLTSDPHHSHSAGAVPSHYQHWQQPYSYPKPVGPGGEPPYGSWNPSHGGPHHLPEENHAPPAWGEPLNGSYYPPPPHHTR
jgi:hypothetical protein